MSPGGSKDQMSQNKNQQNVPHFQGIVNLNDPTSVTMQSSFLIKNHQSANFENYLQMMKRRKTNASQLMMNATGASQMMLGGDQSPDLPRNKSPLMMERQQTFASSAKKIDVCGQVKGRMPAARDGHTACMVGEQMIIFGGDRHRMPFADTYSLNVKSQMQGKNIN